MVAAILTLASAACGVDAEVTESFPTEALDPEARAVHIETTGCGDASGRTGSAVAVGDGVIVTVAHLVARADRILAAVGDEQGVEATVAAVDLERDLAMLNVPANGIPPVVSSSLEAGTEGLIVGAAASGAVPFVVTQVVTVRIEEILGTDRHGRLGYELAARTATGDSGAGAYDETGRLIGIVFATSQDGESSWVTSSVEVEDFLAGHTSGTDAISCDSDRSQLDIP